MCNIFTLPFIELNGSLMVGLLLLEHANKVGYIYFEIKIDRLVTVTRLKLLKYIGLSKTPTASNRCRLEEK